MQPLTAGPRAGLSAAEVQQTLRLEHAPLLTFGVDLVSPTTGDQTGALTVVSGNQSKVTWSFATPLAWASTDTTQAAVRRTATIQVTADATDALLLSNLLRPWVTIQSPTGAPVTWYLGMFVSTLPPTTDDGIHVTRTLTLADRTWLLSQQDVVAPVTVPAGTNPCVWVAADLLARTGETLNYVTTDRVTVDDFTFPGDGSVTVLDMYDQILAAIGYDQIIADVAGQYQVRPVTDVLTQPVGATYGPGTPIMVAGSVTPMLPSIPNQLLFTARTSDVNPITLINQSTGPASVDAQNGHLTTVVVQTSAETAESLADLAANIASVTFAGGGLSFTGTVGLNPGFDDRDRLELDRPRLGLSGDWIVTSWSIPLDGSALMAITADQAVVST